MSNSNVYGVAGKVIRPLGGSITGIKTITGNYTLKPSDHNYLLIVDTTGSIDITIPRSNRIAIGVGFSVQIQNANTGAVTFVPDSNVTVDSINNYLGITPEGGHVQLNLVSLNHWDAEGDLMAALDADAFAWFSAMEATGATFTDAVKGYFNTFFVNSKLNGYYSKYHALYLYSYTTYAANKFNAVNPVDSDAAFRNVDTGSPTHNANGVTFNGTTQYTATKLVPSTVLSQNSKHYSIYVRSAGAGCEYGAVNTLDSYKGDWLASSLAGTQYQSLSKVYTSMAAAGTRTRLWQHNRSASNSCTLKRDGTTIYTDAVASDSNVAYEIYIGGRNNSGSLAIPSAVNICFFAIGDSFTSGEEASERTDVDALQLALGRNV